MGRIGRMVDTLSSIFGICIRLDKIYLQRYIVQINYRQFKIIG